MIEIGSTGTSEWSNRDTAAVGVEARWTFFEFGKTSAELAQRAQEKAALEERVKRIEDSIRLEVKAAHADLSVAETNIRTAEKALEQARENLRITKLQYRQQIVTSTEVLDAGRRFSPEPETTTTEPSTATIRPSPSSSGPWAGADGSLADRRSF